MSIVKQLYELLETRERWRLLGLGLCMLVMAVLETVGVASILPFMKVVSNPELVTQNHWLASVYQYFGFESTRSFLLFLGLIVLLAITINNTFSALTTWLMYRFAWGQNHRLSARLLGKYLDRPYSFYLSHNTSGMSKNILSEVQNVIQGVMLSALRLVSSVMVALLIIGLLAAIDLYLALIVSTVLGGAYGVVYILLRRKQRYLGRERVLQNLRRFQMAGEALAGIKELKILGRERAFLKRFRDPSWRFCRAAASNQVVSTLPRYALETIAFSGVLLIVLYILWFNRDINEMLPILSLYVFAGYRLMPSLNQMFTAGVQIRFNRPALDDLHEDLLSVDLETERQEANAEMDDAPRIRLRTAIRLRELSFTYPGASVPSIHDVSLAIRHQQTVGFVGETGAGKTTLVDLILGLHVPTYGAVEIDGSPLDQRGRIAWRWTCGYIPQEIFLSDDTIRANIALGIPDENVDDEAVRRAARIAQIAQFIETLPKAYDTKVGERGVRLSGGQRQRIGIARALYHDPDVLVMDEATSSLDGATEAGLMEMVHRLSGIKTLIMIAHRLSTVRECDVIFVLKEGRLLDRGTYDDLVERNSYFRSMAGLQPLAVES